MDRPSSRRASSSSLRRNVPSSQAPPSSRTSHSIKKMPTRSAAKDKLKSSNCPKKLKKISLRPGPQSRCASLKQRMKRKRKKSRTLQTSRTISTSLNVVRIPTEILGKKQLSRNATPKTETTSTAQTTKLFAKISRRLEMTAMK